MPPVYKTHRRINAPIEFRGFKAQYILYAGGSVIVSMILFAILFIAGLNSYMCLLVGFGMGAMGLGMAWHLSHRYGIYGWRKRRWAGKVPKALRSGSRRHYLQLKK